MSALSGHRLWIRPGLPGQGVRTPEAPGGQRGGVGEGVPFRPHPAPHPAPRPEPQAHRALGAGSSVPEDGAELRRRTKDTNTEGKPHNAGTQCWARGQRQADQHPQTPVGPPGPTVTPHTLSHAHTHTQRHTLMLTSTAALTSRLPSHCPQSPLPGQAQCPSGGAAPCQGEGSRRGRGKKPRRVRPSCH